MNEPVALLLCVLGGMALGAIFFGGLWWTVGKGLSSQHTALWLICSLFLRMSTVLVGFYWMGHDSWERYLAGLIGFLIARLIVMKFTAHSNPRLSTEK